MPRLSELISEKDREKVQGWVDKAVKPEYEPDIPPELYQVALHGFYFGFGGIEAIFRGYIDSIDQNSGEKVRIPYDLETVIALNQAARKVAYRQIVDMGDVQASASASMFDKGCAKNIMERANKIRKSEV